MRECHDLSDRLQFIEKRKYSLGCGSKVANPYWIRKGLLKCSPEGMPHSIACKNLTGGIEILRR